MTKKEGDQSLYTHIFTLHLNKCKLLRFLMKFFYRVYCVKLDNLPIFNNDSFTVHTIITITITIMISTAIIFIFNSFYLVQLNTYE